jgi:Selenoprotein, putative
LDDEKELKLTPESEPMLIRMFEAVWQWIREAAGENDYERYRQRALSRGEKPAAPEEFYLDGLNRKYSRPNRCC